MKSFNVWKKFCFLFRRFRLRHLVWLLAKTESSSQSKVTKHTKIESFDGITIIVKDIGAQKKFYQDVLGLELESDYGDAVFFKIGSSRLGLFAKGHHKEGDASLEGASKGISYLEFGVSAAMGERLGKKLTDAGFHAYREVFKDADGNLFLFFKY